MSEKELSEKAKTIKKWKATEDYRDNYDQIFKDRAVRKTNSPNGKEN